MQSAKSMISLRKWTEGRSIGFSALLPGKGILFKIKENSDVSLFDIQRAY
jgi:hypothetical protein